MKSITSTGVQIILYHRYDPCNYVRLGLFSYIIKTLRYCASSLEKLGRKGNILNKLSPNESNV